MWSEEVERAALGMRRRAFEHTVKQQGGYLSQVCSSAELLSTLYLRVFQFEESEAPMSPRPFPGLPSTRRDRARIGGSYHGPKAPHLDRFIISPASYSLAALCALSQLGRLDGKALDQYRQDGGSLDLWPAPYTPGFETHSGRDGHGLAYAAGVALGRKLRGENGRVWVLLDAKELASGEVWESLHLLKSKPLTNLVVIINDPQMNEDVSPVVRGWLEACAPWEIQEVNGHDPLEIYAGTQVYQHEGPLLIHARTHPCQGMVYLSLAGLPLDYVRFKSSRARMNFEGAIRAELYKPKPR